MDDRKLRELMNNGLGDCRLAGVSWSDDGEDLVLAFREPGRAAGSRLVLRLAWATEVTIHMDFGEYAGMPLVLGSRFESLPRERWLVEVTFGAAPEGVLRCECNQISLLADGAAVAHP